MVTNTIQLFLHGVSSLYIYISPQPFPRTSHIGPTARSDHLRNFGSSSNILNGVQPVCSLWGEWFRFRHIMPHNKSRLCRLSRTVPKAMTTFDLFPTNLLTLTPYLPSSTKPASRLDVFFSLFAPGYNMYN